MLVKPSEKTNWVKYKVISKEPEHIIWKKGSLFIEQENGYYQVTEFRQIRTWRCYECGAYPELRMDKKTGRYYCTCTSSFIPEKAEIGDVWDNSGNYCINPKHPTFKTIREAIDDWNISNSYVDVIRHMQSLELDSPEDYLKTFYKELKEKYTLPCLRSVYLRIVIMTQILNISDDELCNIYESKSRGRYSMRTLQRRAKELENIFLKLYSPVMIETKHFKSFQIAHFTRKITHK